MKGDKEFTGTLTGFDDYVSKLQCRTCAPDLRTGPGSVLLFLFPCFTWSLTRGALVLVDMVMEDVTE
jgi:hypothetical protein